MNIKINNYKNLQSLNLDICENKINYIFGISGSGKSSIGDALKKNYTDEQKMFLIDFCLMLINATERYINKNKLFRNPEK